MADEDSETIINEEKLLLEESNITPDIEKIVNRVKEIEMETEKLKKLQKEVDMQLSLPSSTSLSLVDKKEADARSVFVGNVDYGSTPSELAAFFQSCGTIKRVTIPQDKNGHQKGYAYIEFELKDGVENALSLNEAAIFRNRLIKVLPKRTNRPGIATARFPQRGRGNLIAVCGNYNASLRGVRLPAARTRRSRSRWYAPY